MMADDFGFKPLESNSESKTDDFGFKPTNVPRETKPQGVMAEAAQEFKDVGSNIASFAKGAGQGVLNSAINASNFLNRKDTKGFDFVPQDAYGKAGEIGGDVASFAIPYSGITKGVSAATSYMPKIANAFNQMKSMLPGAIQKTLPTVGRAAASGASGGLISSDGNRIENALLAAGLGAGGEAVVGSYQGIKGGINKLLQGNRAPAEAQAIANQVGNLPVPYGDIVDSPFLQGVNKVLGKIPFSGVGAKAEQVKKAAESHTQKLLSNLLGGAKDDQVADRIVKSMEKQKGAVEKESSQGFKELGEMASDKKITLNETPALEEVSKKYLEKYKKLTNSGIKSRLSKEEIKQLSRFEEPEYLYHGSPEKTIEKIKDNEGLFDGVFASSSKESALSHGDYLHKIPVNKKEILTSSDINSLPKENLNVALDSVLPKFLKEGADKDRLKALIFDEAPVKKSDLKLLKESDEGDAGWYVQKLRGQVAKKLGYKAVEMSDEHGKSYLVNSNASLKPKFSPMDFETAHEARKTFGELSRRHAKDENKYIAGMYRKLEKAAGADMEKAASAHPEVMQKLETENARFKEKVLPYRKSDIARIMEDKSDLEKIHNTLLQTKHKKIMENLSPELKKNVAYLKFKSAIKENTQGQYVSNPDKLFKAYQNLSPKQKKAIFTEGERSEFKRLGTLAELSRGVSKTNNNEMGAATLALSGDVAAAALHSPELAGLLLGSEVLGAGGSRGINKLLTSPRVRNSLLQRRAEPTSLNPKSRNALLLPGAGAAINNSLNKQ